MSELGIALELRGVSKRFPGTLAVDGVDLEVYAGEVHAVVGENGAGKSTLMKIIAGAFDDYEGEARINGQPVELRTPARARAIGIAMIHQELSLAKPLSIAENLLAGRLPARRGWLDRPRLRTDARHWLQQTGLAHLDPDTPVEDLSQHEAQLVEIARALGTRPCILVMDEPTSALSRNEVERLFGIVRKLRQQGLAILYISHHLPEVMQIADRVTVMRDGRRVATLPIAETSAPRLVEMMVGRKVSETAIPRARAPAAERFRVEQASRYGVFHRVSFAVRAGEILGLTGLAGAGRSEVARSLCGIDPLDEGRLTLDGRALSAADLLGSMRRGLAYLTEDRKREGLALQLSARDNASAALVARRGRLLRGRRGEESLRRLLEELQLYPMEPERPALNFSGGNQQKVLLAKWLAAGPEVCILDEPTRGVDVGAKRVIHEAIARLADQGKCVILISSDLPELCALANRALVMRRGRIVREFSAGAFNEENLLLAANGEGA